MGTWDSTGGVGTGRAASTGGVGTGPFPVLIQFSTVLTRQQSDDEKYGK
jgi:hypothetical protein